MSIMTLFERIQETWLSQAISQSTWGYPIIGALHVLAIALFGGTILITHLCALGLVFRREDLTKLEADIRSWKNAGLGAVLLTGTLLFASLPVHYSGSVSFWIKMVLLALILVNALEARRRATSRFRSLHSGISLVLWIAVIFAARGIAFF